MSGDEKLAVPRLSLAERDRRYRAVRAAMARDNLDVLICPASTSRWEQTMADARYLTTIGGFGTETLAIFPRDGAVTAYVFNRAEFWLHAQDWVTDVRDGRNLWLKNIQERLSEMKLGAGRIGIAGLTGLTRTPDGIIPYATVEGIKAAFPKAAIVNATALMSRVREVEKRGGDRADPPFDADGRSDGRHDRRSSARRYRAHDRGQHDAQARHVGRRPAGDDHHRQRSRSGTRYVRADDAAACRTRCHRGEVEGRYAGYSGQIVRPAVLGTRRSDFRELVAITVAVFDDILPAMKSGASLGSVLAAYEAAVARHGGAEAKTAYPLMHARGLGDEYPTVLSPDDIAKHGDFKLEAGMAFVLKPRVAKKGVPTAQIGDMVVVGDSGGVRLGEEKLGLWELPWPG